MADKVVNPHGRIIGYARVSTEHQKLSRQLDALRDYGVPEDLIFIEKESGKSFHIRPVYKRLLRMLRKGDILVINSIDRLGRNYQGILDQWRVITQDIGCGIHVIDMPLLNVSGDPTDLLSKFITDMMLQVLSFVAESERNETLKRQKAGLEAAKKRGNTPGRPKLNIPFEFWYLYLCWKSGAFKVDELIEVSIEQFGIKKRSFYRRIRELDAQFGNYSYDELCLLDVSAYEDKGFEFINEMKEMELGYYNGYARNPYIDAEMGQRRKEARKRMEREEIETDYAEIRQIIKEKRQQEFAEQFNLQQIKPNAKPRGKKPSIKLDVDIDEVAKTIIIE